VGEHLAEGVRREHLDAVHQRRLLRIGGRHHDLGMARAGGGEHRRQHAADAAHRPVEAELAQQHQPVDRLLGHRAGRREHRGRQCEIEAAALLRHRRRRETDRDPPQWKARPGVDDRGTDPVDRLADHRVGETDEHHLRHAGGHVHLDLHHGAVHPGQTHRPGAGQRHRKAARR
jgi:hypothetical protein